MVKRLREKHSLPRNFPRIFRPLDLQKRGISRDFLQTLLRRGEVQKIARGVYRVTDAPGSENETIAVVSKRIPNSVVCLLTALRIDGIGTQSPKEVWIAINRKARKPKMGRLPIRIVRFSGKMMKYGVLTKRMGGFPIRITSPARTVVDCFRYRRKIGVDVALEALRDAIVSRKASITEIEKTAKACRIHSVIRPYLEAIAS